MKPMARCLVPGPFGPFETLAGTDGTPARTRLAAGRGRLSGSGAGYSSRTPTAFSVPEDRSA